MKEWYDGYLFGKAEVYNPWSAINCMSNWIGNPDYFPRPYWANTSSNDIVRKLIDMADNEAKAELGTLVSGGYISKAIHEDITYNEIENKTDNIWNFLFFTGYLKKVGERSSEDGILTLDLSIPNTELMYIYKTKIQDWFEDKIKQKDLKKLYEAVLSGNAECVQEELNELLLDSISYLDAQENFYHGFMLGIFSKLDRYLLKSNRESGLGRSDIIMKHVSRRGKAIIFEIKWTDDMKKLELESEAALRQIDEKLYVKELEDEGYKKENILKYGIAFCKKDCEVRI
jgi:hypothetical protein